MTKSINKSNLSMWIDSSQALITACQTLSDADCLACDTEFLREKTFWPKLCVLQLSDGQNIFVIDMLAAYDAQALDTLKKLMLCAKTPKIFHAARQDIETLLNTLGVMPAPVYDTQIAAMLVGEGEQVGYADLVKVVTGAVIDKTHQYTDWSKRPLSEEKISYAATDVLHLHAVKHWLDKKLKKNNRDSWMREECAVLEDPNLYTVEPENAWQRFAMPRDRTTLAVLMKLAQWREHHAQTHDKPRSAIMKDEAVRTLAERRPKDIKNLLRIKRAKDLFPESVRDEVLAIINQALMQKDALTKHIELPRMLSREDMITLEALKLLLKRIAADENVAPKLLATTTDLEEMVTGSLSESNPMMIGWRKQSVYKRMEDFLKGDTVLTIVDGKLGAEPYSPPHIR